MQYQVTARKWRPQSFESIQGQEHIVQAVKNALVSGRVPHAYLFSGVRGVGKTTTARVIAKALNCQTPAEDREPCNTCPSCVSITQGSSLDVIEIDGASNRGIDDIRQIRDNVAFLPMSGRYKIYIIDEVHMLTNEASNALLKTLEEPPEHVIFILATTESHKVLPTIKSRCQHYVFKKIPLKMIHEQLITICKADGLQYEDDALFQIATAAEGSMRDAESLFDQIVLYTDGKITEQAAIQLIGVPDYQHYENLLNALQSTDVVAALRTLQNYMNQSGDIKLFVRGWLAFLKRGLLAQKLQPGDELLDLTETRYQKFKALFQPFTTPEIIRIMQIYITMYKDLKGDAAEYFHLESAVFRMFDYKTPPQPVVQATPAAAPAQQPAAAPQPRPVAQPAPAIAAKPAVQAQEGTPERIEPYRIPIQPVKPVAAPMPDSAGFTNQMTQDEMRIALEKALSASMIMRPMIAAIQSVSWDGRKLTVEMGSAHTCEYLTKNSSDLEQNIGNAIGRAFSLSFMHKKKDGPDGTAPAQTKTAETQPQRAAEPVKPVIIPAQKPAAEKPQPPLAESLPDLTLNPPADEVSDQKRQPVNDGTLTGSIMDLFDGKLEK